jgi:hypothetical protein
MPLILFLCSFLPAPCECQRELDIAEKWQAAIFILPAPHDAHTDAAERVEYWQFCNWAWCNRFGDDDRAMCLGTVLAMMAGKWIR